MTCLSTVTGRKLFRFQCRVPSCLTTRLLSVHITHNRHVETSMTTATTASKTITTNKNSLHDENDATTLVDGLMEYTRELISSSSSSSSSSSLQDQHSRRHHVVAFSGGVDSSLVTALLHQVKNENDTLQAVLGLSPAVSQEQVDLARTVIQHIGVDYAEVTTTEGQDPVYIENSGQACLACKTHLYSSLQAVLNHMDQSSFSSSSSPCSHSLRLNILYNGTNWEDTRDETRLGLLAASRFQVQSPLQHTTKVQVRLAARHLGLPNWNAAASPCLRSRLALGVPATMGHLQRIEQAERHVRRILQKELDETSNVRVRMLTGGRAMIEVDEEFVSVLQNQLHDISPLLVDKLGFSSVNARAFRTGSVARPEAVDKHDDNDEESLASVAVEAVG